MLMKKIALFIASALLFAACVNEEAATNTANLLFSAIKEGSEQKMASAYPKISNLPSYYKSDNMTIKEIEGMPKKEIKVLVSNEYTTALGKLVNRDIMLYMRPDSLEAKKYIVYDSEGLCGWDPEENDEYKFALKTGCINEITDVTDQQRAEKMEVARKMMLKEYFNVYVELMTQIRITDWSWDTSYYSDSASGDAICFNGSNYDVPDLKYRVKYYDRYDNLITEDDGYITYDVLKAGRSKSFSFYTSYVGNAQRAKISVEFDDELILKYLADKTYTGKEYEEYLAQQETSTTEGADSTKTVL